jgi:hypothetical protein
MAVRIESQAEPIPGYRLLERLGGGGFGEVWKAVAPGGLHKAIKFVYGDLQTADEEGVRAEQELKAMSRVKTVRHPYILSLERYDIIDGQLIIVMELADRNLWDRFKECRAQGLPGIPRAELQGYMAETAEALDLMNKEYQLQHLDIKPQNLFLVHNHIKVADFGLVKDLEGMVASVTGGVTPVYAAPETFDGWVSRFCDQYSLAIVYQELLTGVRPFSGTSVRQLIMQHLQGTPDLTPLPPGERAAIARALSKNPEDRHPTCNALVKALLEADRGARGEERGAQGDGGEAAGEEREPSAAVLAPPAPAPPTPPSRSSGPVTKWIRAQGQGGDTPEPIAGPALEEVPPRRHAPAEVVGDGVLFPALVVGLGGAGREALKLLAADLAGHFGALEAVPHLRLLYIDTDAEGLRQATRGEEGVALRRSDVMHAPLHRPSHYLKAREGGPRVDSWLNPKMVYRIPRHAHAAGLRALGRLAFVDNYRAIAQRLRGDLRGCTDPEALDEAVRHTGLGIRMNRPRVYVVTSLAGGTGSGMVLDLAYVVRTLLKQLGFERPEVVGLFFVPPLTENPAQLTGVGNAHAALTELNHFSSPRYTFALNCDSRDSPVTGPVVDADPPFSRCVLLPLAEAAPQSLALAGHFLAAELTTPLGRSADMGRREQLQLIEERGTGSDDSAAANPRSALLDRRLLLSTFGLHRVVWPRRAMLTRAARRLCRRLVERWMTKDPKPIKAKVQAWVKDQWEKQELGPNAVIDQLHTACEQALGKPADSAFAVLIDPLAVQSAGIAPRKGEAGGGAEPDPNAVFAVLERLEEVIGRPKLEGDHLPRPDKAIPVGRLEETLRDAGDQLVAAFGQKMAELAVCLIELPAFRLAGAEESIRQLSETIEQILQHHEQLLKELADRAAAAYQGIHALVQQVRAGKGPRQPAGRRAGPTTHPLVGLLRSFSKSRYQSLILQRVTSVFVSLRGQLSDQMREVGFCRDRLKDLCRALDSTPPGLAPATTAGGGAEEKQGLTRYLFPAKCKNLEEAVAHLQSGVSPPDLDSLDQKMQALIRKHFTALVHVCLASANMLKGLERVMQKEAEGLLAEKLTGFDVVRMYLTQPVGAAPANPAEAVCGAIREAQPQFSSLLLGSHPTRPAEVCVLAAPAEPPAASGQPRLRDLARQAVAEKQLIIADAQEGSAASEILFYREEPCLSLADLKLFSPQGRDAYLQMNKVAHFTPHTRTDIAEWQAAGRK